MSSMQITRPKTNPEHVRNIALDIVLTLLTCGLYNIYIQYRQMLAVNDMLGTRKYDFFNWAVFTLITCGIYHVYHEYRKTEDIMRHVERPNSNEPIISIVLAIFGLFIVIDAIQQTHINHYYGSDSL